MIGVGTAERRIGIRELKSKLSEFIREVRSGGTIVVTEPGRPVARMIAATAAGPDATLFCWEAFVSENAHGDTHTQDAATAAVAFLTRESEFAQRTTITAVQPLSVIGAIVLWCGLSDRLDILHEPTEVLPVGASDGDASF